MIQLFTESVARNNTGIRDARNEYTLILIKLLTI